MATKTESTRPQPINGRSRLGGESLSAGEMCDLLGVPYSVFARWDAAGYLLSDSLAEGSGYFHWFDRREVACARALLLLVPGPGQSIGYSRAIRPIIEAIRKAPALTGHVVVAVQGMPPVVVPEAEAATITTAALAEGRTVTLVDGDKLAA